MKKSKIDSRPRQVPGFDSEGRPIIKMETDPYRIELGEFVKFMISYDDDFGSDDELIQYFGSNFGVFYKLLKYVSWSTCYVSPTGRIKKELADFFGIDTPAVERQLRVYRKMGLMKRIGGGSYMINPMKIFVGDKKIQMIVATAYAKEVDIEYSVKGGKDGI